MEKNLRWWQNALVYQIYPLSFFDSNNDGIGDINGIISKLDYLKWLGVDCLWLSPIYASPMVDNGYDISDYKRINPIFGTKKEFLSLLSEVHKKGMKLIMDLVINHTSDQHPWFLKAKSNQRSKYHNYYIWRKTPNAIKSVFKGPAWSYQRPVDKYYFHLFSSNQPDLNWRNQSLRKQIYEIVNYWLDLGIDGFRLDVIDLIGKDVDQGLLADGPDLTIYLKELHENCFAGKDILTVGETPGITIKRAKQLTTPPTNYLNMVFSFDHFALDEEKGKDKWHFKDLSVIELKEVFNKIQQIFKKGGWTTLFWANHDQVRAVSRYGNLDYHEKSAKMLFTILYTLKGTPFVYQGEEIGMTGMSFQNIKYYQDIETINMYNEYKNAGKDIAWIKKAIEKKGRDNSRTPMQWNNSLHAGFSLTKPWMLVNQNYQDINVEAQKKDENSILNYVRAYFKFRKNNPIITFGETIFIDIKSDWLFSYKRVYQKTEIYVIANYSAKTQDFQFKNHQEYEFIMSNYSSIKLKANNKLPPYYVAVYQRSYHGNN